MVRPMKKDPADPCFCSIRIGVDLYELKKCDRISID